jgi:oxygen-independent coproporphyrinogen-3 oxidase
MVDAICIELEISKSYIDNEEITTVYFGGGTPSLLNENDVVALLEKIRSSFTVSDDVEITLEANPDDLTKSKLIELKRAGINRLSVGIQSFFDEHLKFMNRAHNSLEAENCVKFAQEVGFDNISIDLIFGYKGLTEEQWYTNLKKATAFNVAHVSSYALTIEPKTALAHLEKKGTSLLPPDQRVNEQFFMADKYLIESGYEHYEISNYSKPGQQSKHNTSYWQGKKYLGVGPSAHSFNTVSRSWNVSNNLKYLKGVADSKIDHSIENLSVSNQINESILIGLRTIGGLNMKEIELRFGQSIVRQILKESKPFVAINQLKLEGGFLTIPKEHWVVTDYISSSLFVD